MSVNKIIIAINTSEPVALHGIHSAITVLIFSEGQNTVIKIGWAVLALPVTKLSQFNMLSHQTKFFPFVCGGGREEKKKKKII